MIEPDPVEVFDALGIAWGVHELYPNPVEQHAFLSAIRRLESLHDTTLTYEIGAGSVSCEGEELNTTRGGTERLSLRLFVHEVEWLELSGVPSAEDVSLLFSLLAADEQTIRADGGIAHQLQMADVWSIMVTQRGLLTELVENPWEIREQRSGGTGGDASTAVRVAHLIADGAKPQDIAEALVDGAEGEPARVAESFCLAYRAIYPELDDPGTDTPVPEMLSAYRPSSRGRPPVDTFAEAFFLLPEAAQVEILSDFLSRREEGMHALLLDQFAGADLAQLAPLLEPGAYEALLAYARHVVESEAGSADELLPLVSAARDVRAARLSAASRIREMIEGIGGLGSATGGLAGQLRDESARAEELGLHVLRGLFEVEDRPDRFARLVHDWGDRISVLIREGDLDRALVLTKIGTDEAGMTAAKRRIVEQGLIELLRSDYAVFNEAAQAPAQRDVLAEILERFGEPAAVHLMERLSVEEDAATRRVLIGLLVVVGSKFSEPITRFFRAPQWYVVRNAVSIAGKIGGRKWVPYLKPLLDHADHRVVIEAMRALTPLSPDEAAPGLVKCLGHENERVRETAYLLVQSSSSSALGPELASALTDPTMNVACGQIAALLFELGTPEALDTLRQVANTLAVSPTKRHARRAAREVLRSAA